MEATKHGGLAGKERKNRCRNRASRFHHEQLLAEFYDPEPDGMPRMRHIPIRGCGEFLPSIASTSLGEDVIFDSQLEFPLKAPVGLGRPFERRVVWPPDQAGKPVPTKPPRRTRPALKRPRIVPTGKERAGRQLQPRDSLPGRLVASVRPNRLDAGRQTAPSLPLGWSVLPRDHKPRSPFTLGGFIFGCAMGGAAAAMILLVIDIGLR